MHSGKHYSFSQVLFWTRRDIFQLLIISTIPVLLYVSLGWKWISIPWLPVALLGTAVAFVVGFKNNASYERLWEGRRIWGAIVNFSRIWGIQVKDFITDKHALKPISEQEISQIKRVLIDRHIAWLTALRYQLREPRTWEAIYKKHNQEYKNRWFKVDEHSNKLESALANHLSHDEYNAVMRKTNRAAQILALQSAHLKELLSQGLIEDFRHMELEKIIGELYHQQGASERIKNFPYPRQYSTLNLWFIKIFIILLPMGMIKEFETLGSDLIWLTIPFSALAGWIFTTMEKIGESSESPFEGSANDIPITALSRMIEIDLKEMFDYDNIPDSLKPENNILT